MPQIIVVLTSMSKFLAFSIIDPGVAAKGAAIRNRLGIAVNRAALQTRAIERIPRLITEQPAALIVQEVLD